MALRVSFWGVRGTIPCPARSHLGFGGNTSCVEVRAGRRRIVLDGGTGLRALGKQFLQDGGREATILLGHAHLDHINGIPFFEPFFEPRNSFRIMAGPLDGAAGVRAALCAQMAPPLFPVPLGALAADVSFEDFGPGDWFDLGDGESGPVRVRTAPLDHPGGATGYRIEHAGRSVAYVTDTEHTAGRRDANVLGLIDGADLVIYDTTYTDAEYERRVGWGHSTWQEGVRLCREAGARKLALFHHDPDRDDDALARIEAEARETWAGCFAARERLTVTLD